MSHCEDCIKGVLHEGTPAGTFQEIAGISTYVALPTGPYDKEKAVIFLGDIFGQYTNSKLLCDSFAANGFATYFPDYLLGDPTPLAAMNSSNFDRDAWFARHTNEYTRTGLDPVIKYLTEEGGVKRVAATGYCFGGRFIAALAIENLIQVGATAHPAGINVPDDLDAILEKSKVPLLFNACETDKTWPKESQDAAEATLGGGKYAPGWKQNYYPGCTHGFATRGDTSVPAIKFGKENAFEETCKWFKQYL